MNKPGSNLAAIRQHGRTQVDAQREAILDAAEGLFLRSGILNTQMIDIAAQAGITKMSLYRYFPNRDAIALEIHKRMMNRIAGQIFAKSSLADLETIRQVARTMIQNFSSLREAYRYMAMFDHLYLDHPPEHALAHQTRQQLISFVYESLSADTLSLDPVHSSRIIMILSTVIWFLEKLALRGELTWSDQAIPLENHLNLFEEMILLYIDRSLAQTP